MEPKKITAKANPVGYPTCSSRPRPDIGRGKQRAPEPAKSCKTSVSTALQALEAKDQARANLFSEEATINRSNEA